MALLFIDGFDHAIAVSAAAHGTKYGAINLINTSATAVRTGTGAVQFGGGGFLETKPLTASGGAVVGWASFHSAAFTDGNNLLEVREGTTIHLAIGVVAAGQLTIKRGTTVLATGTTVLALNTWYYLEVKAVIHDTAGSYEVRIDGVTEAALTASGVDTRNAGTTGQWDRIRLLSVASTNNSYCDDLYVCDTSSGIRNDFLGVCKVETLLPQTDAVAAGSNAGLTPSTGTDHGALVDETPPNTSDYNSSPTVGLKDTYNYPSLSLTGTILGVQTNLYVAKSDAAARQVCAVVRAGGTDYDGANVAPSTTFGYFSEVRAQNPNTSADWTSADLTTLQAGMKVTV